MEREISFTLNGKPTQLVVDDARPLLWVLRNDLGLNGTKYGCGEAHCGACTVLVDGDPLRSCSLSVKDVAGKRVTTIEGVAAADGALHPVQQAFIQHAAFQCGYCTPGMVLAAYALLARNPHPTREQAIAALDDNLCRCGAHTRILDAVAELAKGGAR
jgi:aerobic-type carbon monoxide dehydrogenase small subunit (CoxS/CutS family)